MSGEPRLASLLPLFESRRDEMVSLLGELVTRESPSDDPRKVSELAEHLGRRLSSHGLTAERLACEGRGNALFVRWGDEGKGTLVLGHLDTVWPVGSLSERPFAADGERVTGPGVYDMKAGIAVAVAVLEAAARGEVTPAGGVTLLLVPDEEVGSLASKGLTVAEATRRGRCLVLEPSGDGGAAKVARKGVGTATARLKGVAAHVGLEPEKGASALLELARLVAWADALADRAVGTTVIPTVARAGSRSNVVPETAELTVDFRFWTAAEGERVAAHLLGYRPSDERVGISVAGGVGRPPMEPTPESLALYERAATLARELGFDLPATRAGGGSDGNLTAAAGVPTLDGLGPAGGGAHAREEHVVLADLPRRAALLAALLTEE